MEDINMCIYCTINNYRKIYEQHHGIIPTDKDNRMYEIHHIDGDHSNNEPSNLTAITIQEHYDIHYAQNDWFACYRISKRMKLSSTEISELARKSNLKRVENKTHHLLSRPDGSSISKDKVASGTHHLLKRVDGTSHATDRIKDGTHPSQTKISCLHCRKIISLGNFSRHIIGLNCKKKRN